MHFIYYLQSSFFIQRVENSYSDDVMRNIFIVPSLPPLSPDDTPTLIFIDEAQHLKSIEVSAL